MPESCIQNSDDVTQQNYNNNWVTVHHKELTTSQGILQNEAKLMVEWFEINAMQAIPDKFQGMLLKCAKTMGDFAITVEGTEIAFVSEINALGVCIDDQLSFNAHVDRICTKAGRQVSALQRLTGVIDYESRLAIYKSFIMSNFDYCPIVWFLLAVLALPKWKKFKKEHRGLSSRTLVPVTTKCSEIWKLTQYEWMG